MVSSEGIVWSKSIFMVCQLGTKMKTTMTASHSHKHVLCVLSSVA